MTKWTSALTLAAASIFTASASAQNSMEGVERVGKPESGGMWFPPAVGEQAQNAQALNIGLIWLSIIVSIFVLVLLVLVILRFRDRGKEPKRFSHNTPLEIAWTLVPVLILVVIAWFSAPALKAQVDTPEGDVVIKVTGYQWYWGYEYPTEGIVFDSIMLERDELAEYGYTADEYLLAVDNPIVVPVNKTVVVQITAADVIHAWKIPSFYVMADAMPGRTNQQWFKADREGLYFGQCSELCGKNHAYMPIALKVVSEEEYAEWVKYAQDEFAAGPASIQVASN